MTPNTYVDHAREDMREMGYFEAREKADQPFKHKPASEMYYPKLDPDRLEVDNAALRRTVDAGRLPRSCALCDETLGAPRHYRDENLYCMACLQRRWFCPGPWPEGVTHSSWDECPVEVFAIIATFLSEYCDFAAFCRVNSRCFEAANGDSWYESEITVVKRFTITKELHLRRQRDPNGFGLTWAGDFSRRLAVGNIVGEFVEPETTPRRKLRLIGLMVASQYVAHVVGVTSPRASLLPVPAIQHYFDSDGGSTLTITDSQSPDDAAHRAVIRHDPGSHRYIAHVVRNAPSQHFEFHLEFDDQTGLLLSYQSGAAPDSDACSKRRCIIA